MVCAYLRGIYRASLYIVFNHNNHPLSSVFVSVSVSESSLLCLILLPSSFASNRLWALSFPEFYHSCLPLLLFPPPSLPNFSTEILITLSFLHILSHSLL